MAYAFVPTGLLALALKGARTAAAVAVPTVGRLAIALRNRHAVQRLCDLDDRALKDIGLVRSDVAGALAEPMNVDPSSILSDRRLDRARRPERPDGRAGLVPPPVTPRTACPGHLPRPAV